MVYNPDIHHRRSIRLVGYDYSRSGAYFITICTHNRECIFGEIVDRAMNYNEFGNIARSYWQNLATHHPNIELDESFAERTGGNRHAQSFAWNYHRT
jgi:putative transposase